MNKRITRINKFKKKDQTQTLYNKSFKIKYLHYRMNWLRKHYKSRNLTGSQSQKNNPSKIKLINYRLLIKRNFNNKKIYIKIICCYYNRRISQLLIKQKDNMNRKLSKYQQNIKTKLKDLKNNLNNKIIK